MLELRPPQRTLIEQLLATLQALPNVSAHLSLPEKAPSRTDRQDTELNVTISGTRVTLLVELKKTAFPRDVREFLWHLQHSITRHETAEFSKIVFPLLAAESISAGAKQLLRDEQVGYFDTGGSLFLPALSAYIYIDKPAPKTLTKTIRSFFFGRRSQVLHVLLQRRKEWIGVKDLAKQALVSPATASETLSALERFDWVISRGQGPIKERCLSEPGALLDTWATQITAERPPVMHRYFVPAFSTDKLLAQLAHAFDERGVEYALTYEAAAQQYAPFLSSIAQVRCRVQHNQAANDVIHNMNARSVVEGANLVILEAKTPGDFLFRERFDNAWLASPIQVYLDLLRGEGRAIEMAEHLRKERIGF